MRRSQPEPAIVNPRATRTLSTAERVRARQARDAGSSTYDAESSVGPMGYRGPVCVDLPPETEDKIDLAARLASRASDDFGRASVVRQRPDCSIALSESTDRS